MAQRNKTANRFSGSINSKKLPLIIFVLLFAVVGVALLLRSRAAAENKLGVYVGTGDADRLSKFETWLGHPVPYVLDYLDGRTWDSISNPNWIFSQRAAARANGHEVIWGVPMLPSTDGRTPAYGTSFKDGAAGAYNQYFRTLAQNLVNGGDSDAIIRMGWEFNGNWFPWSVNDSNYNDFIGEWRQIVTTMRQVSPNFKFTWNPTLGTMYFAPDRAYPGDAYVDYISLDHYDGGATAHPDAAERWNWYLTQPFGLNWHRDFANAHGKQMSYDEWGLWHTTWDSGGGGDDSYFIQQMNNWINGNNVKYAIFWQDPKNDNLGMTYFPTNYPTTYTKSAATFKSVFSASMTTPTVASVTLTGISSGQTVAGSIVVEAKPINASGVTKIDFYIDGTLTKNENYGPYCLAGDATATTCAAYDTTKLTNGNHTIKAVMTYNSGANTAETSVSFTVSNGATTTPPPPPSGDTTAPTAPTNLRVTNQAFRSISLSWTASTDNVGVTGYYVYRNGGTDPIALVASTTYTDQAVTPNKTYTYKVTAVDAQYNESSASNTVTARTGK